VSLILPSVFRYLLDVETTDNGSMQGSGPRVSLTTEAAISPILHLRIINIAVFLSVILAAKFLDGDGKCHPLYNLISRQSAFFEYGARVEFEGWRPQGTSQARNLSGKTLQHAAIDYVESSPARSRTHSGNGVLT
jgi:hypothetical protein